MSDENRLTDKEISVTVAEFICGTADPKHVLAVIAQLRRDNIQLRSAVATGTDQSTALQAEIARLKQNIADTKRTLVSCGFIYDPKLDKGNSAATP